VNCYPFNVVLLTFLFVTGLAASEKKSPEFYRSKGLYAQGAEYCQTLLDKTQNPQKRKKLLIDMAACYQFNTRDHTYQKAVDVYRQFINKYPDDPLCAKAYFNIGRCYDAFTLQRKKDIGKAREAYKTCYGKYPGNQWADQAYFWHANSYIYKLTAKSATISAGMFEQLLKRYPKSFLTGVVHSQLSELYCAWLNKYKLAVEHSEAALQYGIQSINVKRQQLYRLGYLYQFKLHDNQQAVKWYKKLVAASPTKSDPNYFVAKKRIRELQRDTGGEK
jgi:tetratricopeptide (TPR) repeat protein